MSRPGRATSLQPPAGFTGRRAFGARGWVTVVALLAFFLQSLVVQTHIHQPGQTLVAKAASAHMPASTPLKNSDPIDQCRLCQELVHANAFVTPSTIAVYADLGFVLAIFAPLPVFIGGLSRAFAWQSRAPPRR